MSLKGKKKTNNLQEFERSRRTKEINALFEKSVREKLEKVIELLTESHLDSFGGYPHDYAVIGDKLVVAGLDAGKENAATELSVYYLDSLLRWYHDAVYEMGHEPDMDFETAMYEVGEPCQAVTDDIPD